MTPNMLLLARRLVARDLSVFPVPRARPGLDGKTPVISWKRYQTTRPTDAELVAWFSTPQNLAIVTGDISNVVVVDVDAADALDWVRQHLPSTPWQTRTAKGLHLWFRHPGSPVHGKVRVRTDAGKLALDVRGDACYVMSPGSLHASGIVYRFEGDWRVPKAELPVFSLDWLSVVAPPERVTKQETRMSPSSNAGQTALKRARAYLMAIPRPEIGCGSDLAVFTVACRLVRGFALPESDAEDLLFEWAGSRPGWTREWIALKVRSASARDRGEQIGGYL
jgi:hypothetical protein